MIQKEIRLIDEKGKQIGILEYEKALGIARERGFDLIEVTKKTQPPIFKLGNYDKIRYFQEKEKQKRKLKERHDLAKTIKISFKESVHDLTFKAKQTDRFLTSGRSVEIQMPLRGREKTHSDLAIEKIKTFLTMIKSEYKIIQDLKKTPNNLLIVLKKIT